MNRPLDFGADAVGSVAEPPFPLVSESGPEVCQTETEPAPEMPVQLTGEWTDRFIPREFRAAPDRLRRARLMLGFSGVGIAFGLAYTLFYLFIGHRTGAGIIAICVALLCGVPLVMRKTASLTATGHLICLITMTGFTALTVVEKGVRGHSIAWLATGSLIALLLLGRKAGFGWALTGMAVVGFFCALEIFGITLPPTYPAQWEFVITSGGYLGFVAFLFILGAIFEKWRGDAHRQLDEARMRLSIANDRLVGLNKEKNEFLGVAAHDLRNPLSTIMLCGEMISLKAADPAITQEMARRMVREAGRMRDLINELLDVNAIESGNSDLHPVEVNLSALSREVMHMFDLRIAEKHQVLAEQIDENLHVFADRRALTQVLENLLSNALKFSPPGGRIQVSLIREGDNVIWRVIDSGPGITEDDRAKLFSKFAKLSARPTAGEASIGLGLSIVKRFVDSMGGRIRCDNHPHGGACFAVSFHVIQPGEKG